MSNNTATIRTLGHLHDLTPDPDLRRCDGSACGRPRAHGHPGSRPDRMSVRHTVSAAVDSFLVDSLSHPTPWGRLGTDDGPARPPARPDASATPTRRRPLVVADREGAEEVYD